MQLTKPSDLIETQARIMWIEEQVEQLAPKLKSMFQLRYRFGWTLKRIAKKFGMQTGAVDGRIRREIERIKRNAEQKFSEKMIEDFSKTFLLNR